MKYISMSLYLCSALLILLLLASDASAQAVRARVVKYPRAVPDSYIVQLNVARSEVEQVARELVQTHGAQFERVRGRDSLFSNGLKGFGARMSSAVADAVAQDPRVALVEENAVVDASVSLSDQRQWNLDRADETTPIMQIMGQGVQYVGNLQYNYITSGNDVYVYVVDGGVYSLHPEFKPGQVVSGPNFSGDSWPANRPCDGEQTPGNYQIGTHGTAVASVIGGQTVGVAPNAKIVPIKIADCYGYSQLLWYCWGVDWIATPSYPGDIQRGNPYPKIGAVANMSIFIDAATPWDTTTPPTSLENAVNNVVAAGVTMVVSANNQFNNNCTTVPARMAYGNQSGYPSTYRVISVGGTDQLDRRWQCSNWSDCVTGSVGSNAGPCVDIYAPAHDVKVAYPGANGQNLYRAAGGWSSGTSFAAPYVAGLAARWQEKYGRTLAPITVWGLIWDNKGALGTNFDGDNVATNDYIARMGGNL